MTLDARAKRKFQLDGLLHTIEGRAKIEEVYDAVCKHAGNDGIMQVRPADSLPLRLMIDGILAAEFPAES